MVYRFTIISDEVDDFIREIQIDSEATFYELHEAILKAAKYNNDQMTSFFTCDEDWERNKKSRWKTWVPARMKIATSCAKLASANCWKTKNRK